MPYTTLVLNTGSTSTKLAIYRDKEKMAQEEYIHDREFLMAYPYMADQVPMREAIAEEFFLSHAPAFAPFDAVVARGGILCPVRPGGYEINGAMLDYLENICEEEHASNVAAPIAYSLKNRHNIPKAYIYDSIASDELEPIARISGIPDLPRVSTTHALNMRAIAHKAADQLGKAYRESTIIVAHLGGGSSLSLHRQGKMVDMVSDDEGPFSAERGGGQQVIRLIKYMDSQTNIRDKIKIIRGGSGLKGYFGTTDAREVEGKISGGDRHAQLVYEAMAYQVAKAIGGLATVGYGKIDCIALTGGLARSQQLTGWIAGRTAFIAPCFIYPGENEMESLAFGALRLLKGEEPARTFVYQRG